MSHLTGDEQIEKLADFITDNALGEPSQSEGAVDIAIQIIEAQHSHLVALGEAVRMRPPQIVVVDDATQAPIGDLH
jgi:hypothetical protein